jgi:hypothetical protein
LHWAVLPNKEELVAIEYKDKSIDSEVPLHPKILSIVDGAFFPRTG